MSQSLERISSLPLLFDPGSGRISWPRDVAVERESARSATEMAEYQADPSARASADPVYRMYRNVAKRRDAAKIAAAKLRYDITVIPSGRFSGARNQFFRTAGHYHPTVPGGRFAYPEVYEVLSGRAYWLIQRPRPYDPETIEEIYTIEAGPGEKAIIPPGFGHTSVNAFSGPLVMANWINDSFVYDYEPYKKFRGSGYRMFEGTDPSIIEFERNQNYRDIPEIVKLRPKELPEFGLTFGMPAYQLGSDLNKLTFLSRPDDFAASLSIDHCFRRLTRGS